jgi:glycosyltransferase involved in cell wall biosynthesis
VICPKAAGFKKSYERLENVDIFRYCLPFEAYGPLSYILEFAWCFIQAAILSIRVEFFGRGFDVIHACNPPDTYWLLGLLWRVTGKKFLFDHHDLSPEMYEAKYNRQGGFLYKILLWLEKMTFYTSHTVIVTNQSYKEIACERGRVSPDRIFVVRSGPDNRRFKLLESTPALKQGRRFMCSYLGKMCEQDGVDYLIRVAKILCIDHQRNDILFTFMGGGPAQPDLVRYAEEIGVREHCYFTGYIVDDEVSQYLSTTDVAVDPDPKTTWSDKSTMNKILEYMFFGCPIVAFDLKENRFSAQTSAIYVTPNIEHEMADAIEKLLADENQRRFMGEQGKKRVRTKLLWENSVPNLLAAYEHVFKSIS